MEEARAQWESDVQARIGAMVEENKLEMERRLFELSRTAVYARKSFEEEKRLEKESELEQLRASAATQNTEKVRQLLEKQRDLQEKYEERIAALKYSQKEMEKSHDEQELNWRERVIAIDEQDGQLREELLREKAENKRLKDDLESTRRLVEDTKISAKLEILEAFENKEEKILSKSLSQPQKSMQDAVSRGSLVDEIVRIRLKLTRYEGIEEKMEQLVKQQADSRKSLQVSSHHSQEMVATIDTLTKENHILQRDIDEHVKAHTVEISKNERLEKENRELSLKVREKMEEADMHKKLASDLRIQLEDREARLTNVETTNNDLESEIRYLKRNSSKYEASLMTQATIDRLNQEKLKLEQDVSNLQAQRNQADMLLQNVESMISHKYEASDRLEEEREE